MSDSQPALLPDPAAEITSFCLAWRVTRTDGRVFGFTEHDADLQFDGTAFLAGTGFTASEQTQKSDLSAASGEVTGGFSSEIITDSDLAAGLYDGAKVDVFRVDWTNTQIRQLIHRREIGEVVRMGTSFRAELRSLASRLGLPQGQTLERRCRARFGDALCTMPASDPHCSMATTLLDGATRSVLVIPPTTNFAVGAFSLGNVTFLSGANQGVSRDILTDSLAEDGSRALCLYLPLGLAVSAGDTVQVVVGCDRSFATCRDTFANALNFRGFPHMPGADFAYSVASGDAIHDGGVIIP